MKEHNIKIVKREDKREADRDKYIESHELSILSLLVEKHPERAREFLRKLNDSMKVAA